MSGAMGPSTAMPRDADAPDGGFDLLDLLPAEQTVLTGVRVQSGDRDARRRAQPGDRLPRELDDPLHPIGRGTLDRLAQRAVRRDVRDDQVVGHEHDRHVGRATDLADQLRVAGEVGSESCVASLFIGRVTIASISPASAAVVADTT